MLTERRAQATETIQDCTNAFKDDFSKPKWQTKRSNHYKVAEQSFQELKNEVKELREQLKIVNDKVDTTNNQVGEMDKKFERMEEKIISIKLAAKERQPNIKEELDNPEMLNPANTRKFKSDICQHLDMDAQWMQQHPDHVKEINSTLITIDITKTKTKLEKQRKLEQF
ncbi:hypothetical protein H4Q26_016245 [Puccinia striiformis f. sp. tritici PST-130]|nr:hypothetical protein H4Q26_016245 [Puccinia striiformis f. sp. tritici PST-130]